MCETIPAEDFAVAEQVQRNIDAGSAPIRRIGTNEHRLVEHLRAVDHLIGPSSLASSGPAAERPLL